MKSTQSSIEFVRALELPQPSRNRVAGMEDDGAPFPNFGNPELAVTVGSQIASFADGLGGPMKQNISNAFLFAQQAADKQIENVPSATTLDWYDTYINVLSRIGWNREKIEETRREVSGTSVEVHKAITPVIAAALGPTAAATALIVRVLEGLEAMDENSPWITLFNQASQRAHANQFQISHADVADGKPRIKLVAFELDAQKSVTQVLFFKLSDTSAKLRHFETPMSVDATIFEQVAPILSERLADRARDFIAAIDI